ncbi:ArdC-like ssDNA-binding domain-containing protein [Prevotella nigrescens]|uniref:ArdC-like ssDNA-binding domain-containing protein n=1 Tax=Prevotella nigrescens TaxID=28133 RepID=UPI0028DB1F60|nr:ArdC-like ssDNA-binding domain-containing protein [Prevotella nigrescens]
MSGSNHSKNLFHGSLLSGWNKMFGKKKDNVPGKVPTSANKGKKGLKAFPENHFFSPEELSHLSKNQGLCTLLQRWALEKSLWAKEKSQQKDDPLFFPSVEWQDGLLITWIDSKEVPEDIDQQADRLFQLQLEGYELSEHYVRMIDARACRTLVGSLFVGTAGKGHCKPKEGQYYLRIRGVTDKSGEELSLSVFLYGKISHHADKEEIISYKDLRQQIEEKKLTALGNEWQRKWNEEATKRDDAEKKYSDLLLLMKKENVQQGMFPISRPIRVHIDGRDYFPKAWSLYSEKLRIDVHTQHDLSHSAYLIEHDESYLFVEVLDHIHEALSVQEINRELRVMIDVFGKKTATHTVLSSQDDPICKIGNTPINSVTFTSPNGITALSSSNKESIVLTKESKELLLRGVMEHADTLIRELKSALKSSTDRITRELLQDKLDTIHKKLLEYCAEDNRLSLEELWKGITLKYGIKGNEKNPIVYDPFKAKTAGEMDNPDKEKPNSTLKERVSVQESQPVEGQTGSVAKSGGKEEKETVPLPEGYIPIGVPATGRWHTEDILRQEAYRIYGKLLSGKLQKQLHDEQNPWVSKKMMLPRATDGRFYTGINAIMLALWTEEKGFELPFFITEGEMREKGYGILNDADSLFILVGSGASRTYNIAQTSFPVTQRRAYESLKMNMAAMEGKKTTGYQFLDDEAFHKTALSFDGTPGLSIYDYANKVIHIAPKDNYESEDDYYRDLAISMVESTRDVDFETLRLDAYLFENLVSHLGSGIISQFCRFNATNPEYSKIWKERLESTPAYTRRILEQSALSSQEVLQVSLDT